jgi:serine/threonine protein phosphatase PrpC
MWEACGLTDLGCLRSNNEDCFILRPDFGLYVVADGMGGAQAGERASQIAATTVVESLEKAEHRDAETLQLAFQEANQRVLEAASGDLKLEGMGTTLVAALTNGDDGIFIASVGDSRAYVFENGVLQALTEDQTWVNEVGRRLGMDDASLKCHPMRHVLTMAIGVNYPLRMHCLTYNPATGAQVLLCSDGLHGVIGPEVIAEVLSREITLEAKCHSLVEAARQAGGPDNITVVVARAGSPS